MDDTTTQIIAGAALFVAIVSAYFSWHSAEATKEQAEVSKEQFDYITRKIGMITDPTKMTEILPVWYIERMAQDEWGFGLLLTSGDVLAISRIIAVSDDGHWLEARLLDRDSGPEEIGGHKILYAALEDRETVSVKIEHIQAAFEIVTS